VPDTALSASSAKREGQQQLPEHLTSTMNQALHATEHVLPVQGTNLHFLLSHSMTFDSFECCLNLLHRQLESTGLRPMREGREIILKDMV